MVCRLDNLILDVYKTCVSLFVFALKEGMTL